MISIIVVGYNSKKDLKECFDSIYASVYNKYRIIFVDNDSSDGSINFVEKNFPKVITIKNKNTGYAGGNNIGIQKATELQSDYVFLLNPDTTIDQKCLGSLVEKADDKTILQPLILLNLDGKNTELINTTGGHLNFLGFSYCSDYKENKSIAKEKDIAIASGAAVFVPTAVLQKTGLFDESFFMYHEDVDLFWRARIMGFNIRLIPASIVWHKYSFSKNKKKLFYADRNRLIFLHKNFSLKYRILIFPAFVINEILMVLYSLFAGWFVYKIKAYVSAIGLINSRNSSGSRLTYQEFPNIKDCLKAEISFSEVKSKAFTIYNVFLRFYWRLISWVI